MGERGAGDSRPRTADVHRSSGSVLADSLVRLSPTRLISNPVMLIVEITFFIVAAMAVYPQGFASVASLSERLFYVEIAIILLITVWFSTLSDSLAEQQAKNTASSLRKLESEVPSKKIVRDGWSKTMIAGVRPRTSGRATSSCSRRATSSLWTPRCWRGSRWSTSHS